MPLSIRQQAILADIGIPVWKIRGQSSTAEAGVAPVADSESAATLPDLSASVLLVMSETALGEPEQRLLGAMLKAVSLSQEQVVLLDMKQFAQLPENRLHGKNVLFMGEAVARHYMQSFDLNNPVLDTSANSSRVACYSLAEMLQKPALKAAAWQALKQLKTVF